MKYIIYGTNRVARDFLYIFDELEIVYVTDDRISSDRFCGYAARPLEDALADRSYDRIVICDFEKADKEKRLTDAGLKHGEDYLYEEEFFAGLDDWTIPKDRRIAVWGTGNMAREFMASAFMASRRDEMPVEVLLRQRRQRMFSWTALSFRPGT